ncbi:MAG: TIGR04053 family radical SAM/SPASM domain-containing protein [Dehalococcoidia bacterium]|nr:TIGR04053 family radical SAM/SPASM domain-containing protein [Dehalococcoidia bacterium]MDP7469895.1 TIGR04053 family radical SAM/SPASM domain-containing protein [Dehalococcoidia bacterium]
MRKSASPETKGVALPLTSLDFNFTPFIVFWEVTRACAFACRHCRAKAQPWRHPQELSTEEGLHLIDQVADTKAPLLVFTGGDPMMRPDILKLISYAAGRVRRVSLAPSATHLVTPEAVEDTWQAGVSRFSVSLDGATAGVQDSFRGMPGSFKRTMEILEVITGRGYSVQVNTTVSRYNVEMMEEMASVVEGLRPAMWDIFFMVPTGRGTRDDMITPRQHEEVFRWLYHYSYTAPFDIKTTAGQHYRRVAIQESGGAGAAAPGFTSGDGIGRARGVNDGSGCCFVSHTGEVYPSGFLPLVAGNVRQNPLSRIYRDTPIFQELRDTARLKGKCGRCEYKMVCGGSRSRAYAVTGDYLQAEPCCIYQPEAEGGRP